MDAKDFRLLVALDEDARQSFQALGRKVSLSAPAVRDRIR
ncbi:MAG TPA: AsnC family transcriptional regulator, partial [Thermoplasmata archaeon]|nr:AsnC family transcriptional regulator [Thermoplasmata archaeon]